MKNFFYTSLLLSVLIFGLQTQTKAAGNVTISSTPIASANVLQGSSTNVVYIAKMDVTTADATINNVEVPLGGTHDADDLGVVYVYFNPTNPTIAGSTLLGGLGAAFGAPHTYDINVNKPIIAGTGGYFLVTVNVNNAASDGKTIKVNGATAPLVFGYSTAPAVTDNQSNASGTFTIQAADVTLTSTTLASATVLQGSATNVVYIAKMNVATEDVTVSNVEVPLGGTHDADDLGVIYVYFNPTNPTIAGSTLVGGLGAAFGAPHTYDINVNKPIIAGTGGYFLVTVNVNNAASDGKTIKVNGGTGPVVFGFITSPNIMDNQSNASGTFTIQAADVTLTSTTLASATVLQGSATNVVYIAKMNVATEDVTVSNVEVPLGGTHDADDLGVIYVYFNPTNPTIAGSTLVGGLGAAFGAPHTYDINVNKPIIAGTGGYFLVTVNVNNAASDGKTIKVNGGTAPVIFGFITSPNITDNQSNASGTFTIQAADVTLTSTTLASATVLQGSATNVVYIAKMNVATEDVTVSNVEVPLGGTHDADDLGVIYVYFNPTNPTIAGSTLVGGLGAAFGAPHTYDINVNKPIIAGTGGYFLVTVNVNNAASDGKTIKVNGGTGPVVFGFITSPNIMDNQSNAAGTFTIEAADVTLTSSVVPAGDITKGSSTNVVYIAKMDVATQDVTVSNVEVPLGGTHDADDLTVIYVYFNATNPTIAGSTLVSGLGAGFAAPHTYDISVNKPIIAGTGGYFLITVNTSATATLGNTVKVNGATAPVVFGFITAPNVTDNQTNAGGLQTLPVNLVSVIARSVDNGVQVNWVTTSEINNAFFEIQRSADGSSFETIGRVEGNGTSTSTHHYSFTDNSPGYGNNYYRLKQINIDNNFYYSNIISVSFNVTQLMVSNLYPNPVKDVLTYSISSPEIKKLLLNFTDMSGRFLISKTINVNKGINKLQLNISRFASGNYQVNIVDPKTNASFNKRVIILH